MKSLLVRNQKCLLMILFLFDLLNRMDNASAAKHALHVRTKYAEEFISLVESDNFKQQIQHAVKDPTSDENIHLTKLLKRMIL